MRGAVVACAVTVSFGFDGIDCGPGRLGSTDSVSYGRAMVWRVDERVDVRLADVRISCSIGGTEGKPPLVMVHGGACDGSTWDDIAAAFADEYRIYRPDLRGHGESGWARDYTVDLLGADLLGLGEALGLKQATVVGHSLGGQAGLVAALRRPGWLRRLVVEDTMLRPEPLELPPLGERPEGIIYDWDGIMPPLRAEAQNPNPRWWTDLPSVAVPTLFLAGDAERPTTGWAREAVEIMPDARLKVMGTGHFVHADKPREFVAELRGFFAANPLD